MRAVAMCGGESDLRPYIWDAFLVNPETLEFAYCDAHYQYYIMYLYI